jgi:hypothetical protein
MSLVPAHKSSLHVTSLARQPLLVRSLAQAVTSLRFLLRVIFDLSFGFGSLAFDFTTTHFHDLVLISLSDSRLYLVRRFGSRSGAL